MKLVKRNRDKEKTRVAELNYCVISRVAVFPFTFWLCVLKKGLFVDHWFDFFDFCRTCIKFLGLLI